MGTVRGDNSLYFSTALDNSGLRQGSLDAVGIIQGLAGKIGAVNPFGALAVAASSAFAIIAKKSYEMAKNFEHAMKEVETISEATKSNFKGISEQVYALSKITPDNPEKLAKAYYQIVSAGYDGARGLNLLEVAAKAAVGGVTDTTTAADGLTTVMNAFKIESERASEVADLMFQTVKLGKTTFSELAASMSTVAPIASASNIGFEQVSAAVATLTKQGVPTAQAMTQIRAAIIAANEVLGDGWANTMNLQDAFQSLYETANGSQTKLREMVGTVEAVGAILGTAGKNFIGAKQDLEAMNGAVGASEEAYGRMATSNINQSALLQNKIRSVTESIGNFFLGMSNKAVSELNKIFESTDNLSGKYKEQAEMVNKLFIEYTSLNVEEKRRLEILEELKRINPKIVEGINDQATAYDKLGDSVRNFNQYVRNKELVDDEFGESINGQKNLIRKYSDLRSDVQADLYNEYNTFISNFSGLKIQSVYKDELTKIIDSEGSLIDKITKIRAELRERNAGVSSAARVTIPFDDIKQYQKYSETINLVGKALNNLETESKKRLKSRSDNTFDAPYIIEEIKNINSLIELEKEYGDYQTKSIKDAVTNRKAQITKQKEIATEISKINTITKAEYLKNKTVLEGYLKSEDKQISEAAKKRKAFFEYKPNGGGGTVKNTFEDGLKVQEERYKQYTLAIENNDLELAKNLKDKYKLKEEDYITYLRNLYAATKDYNEKGLILDSLEKVGSGINDRSKVESIKTSVLPVKVIPELDTTSVNAIEARLKKLNEDFRKAQTEEERKNLAAKIKVEDQKLKAAQESLNDQKEIVKSFYDFLQTASRKQLVERKKQLKTELEEVKKKYGKEAEEFKLLKDQIDKLNEETGKSIVDIANQFSSGFSELSTMFSKFGDEDTAKLLDQLSGVATGIGKIASGDYIGGGLSILNSAVTVEVVSDTSKFEDAIKTLEKAIKELDFVIAKSVGTDKIDSRLKAIEQLKELEEQAKLAVKAEEQARKELKFFGLTAAIKAPGTGTDFDKLESLQEQADEAVRKVQELKDELNELYIGTSKNSIVDGLLSGFREGKRGALDFADYFKELMQDAMLEAFQIKYLDKQVAQFYDLFAEYGSDSNYTSAEIEALRGFYNNLISGAQSDLDAINQVLASSGIGKLGSGATSRSGLTGEISNIREETAGELAGLVRKTSDDVRLSVTNGVLTLEQLRKIEQNTYNTVLRLDTAIEVLREIKKVNEDNYYFDVNGV